MLALTVCCLALLAAVSGQQCDKSKCNQGLLKYYKELNCQPIETPGECCPKSFDCTGVLNNRSPDKCYMRGRSFNPDSRLTSEDVGDKCIAECLCSKRGPQASLTCVSIECPELFHGPPAPGCVRLYSHDQCCSTREHCTNGTSAKEAFKCDYGGQSYFIGQKFWPDEKPCMTCICQQGFDGTLKEPWCKEFNCGIETHYASRIKDGCAPIFFGNNRCCPIGWRCPEDTDNIVPSSDPIPAGGPKCVFGKLNLAVSQRLYSDKSCVECKCSIPPHVSCVQTGHC